MKIGSRTATALTGLVAALLLLGPAAAGAAAGPDGETAPEAKAPPQVQLVLDVSGSMREPMAGGGTRMDAAKQAFNGVIDALPPEVHLGIRTLGATYDGDDQARGCVDSEQLYPVGPVDRTEAKTAVATLAPVGWTPIGHALREAVADFPGADGTRRIVLITDGEDSCGEPDPCDVARELAAEGAALTVDTLGLTPDDAGVRNQLSCIAGATGGTYTAVQDTDQLRDRLVQLVDRTVEQEVLENPAVIQGSGTGCDGAPLLTAGVYSDRAEFGEHRWYQLELAPGHEVRAAVSVAADRAVDRDYGVLLRLLAPDGRELVRGGEAGSGRTDVISTGLRYPHSDLRTALGEDGPSPTGAHLVCLEASHSFSAPDDVQTSPGMPVELTVDLVAAPGGPADTAAFGLARGWVPLVLLTVTGLVAGVLWGLIRRVL